MVDLLWCCLVKVERGGRGVDEGYIYYFSASSQARRHGNCAPFTPFLWLLPEFAIHHSAALKLFFCSTRVSHQTIHSISIWKILRSTRVISPHICSAAVAPRCASAPLPLRSAPATLSFPPLQSPGPVCVAWAW